MTKKAIHVKKLYDGSLNPPRDNAVVLVDGEKIEDVVNVQEAKAWAQNGAEWVDASEKYMTPGLIDVHLHLMMNGNGEMAEETLAAYSPGELHLLGLRNALTSLSAGVTAIRDCGSAFGISRAVKRFIGSGLIQGPDVFICGMPITRTGGHCHYMGGEVDTEADIRKLIRRQQKEGIDFVKLMGTFGGTIGVVGGNTFSSPCEYGAAVDEAHRMGFKITTHCLSIEGVTMALDAGTDGIEHCQFVSEKGGPVIMDQALMERIAKQNIQVCHTLSAMGAAIWTLDKKPRSEWTPNDQAQYDQAQYEQEILYKTVLAHYKAGIQLVAGSDSGWVYNNYSLGLPLALELMQTCGIPALEIIHSATGRPAKYLRAEDRLGGVKKGLQADMVLLSADPGKDVTVFHRVERVYKKGSEVTNFLF